MLQLELYAPILVRPMPGEALHSLLGRWLAVTGSPSASPFVQALTGKVGRRISLGLPGRLAWLQKNFQALDGFTVEELVERFTIAPLYRPFHPPEQWKQVVEHLASDGSREARMLLGVARGAGEQIQPMHCRQCVREQLEEHGQPYWCMRFVLPYVRVCPSHGLRLEPLQAWTNIRLAKHKLLAPPSSDVFGKGQVVSEPVATEAEVRLSRLAISLHAAGLQPVPYSVLVRTYFERFNQLDLVDAGGRVRRAALWGRLQKYWDGLTVVRCSPGRTVPAWVSQLYSEGRTAVRSPLHHLLAIGALFADVQSWRDALDRSLRLAGEMEPRVNGRVVSRPLMGTKHVQLEHWISKMTCEGVPVKLDARVAALLRKGLPAREVAALTGWSRATLYRRLRQLPELAKSWASAALREEHRRQQEATRRLRQPSAAGGRCPGPTKATKKWLYRHRAALALLDAAHPR